MNSRKYHYILDGYSLCRRWTPQRPFRRAVVVETQCCRDCYRYVQQLLKNKTLPVPLPDELEPRRGRGGDEQIFPDVPPPNLSPNSNQMIG